MIWKIVTTTDAKQDLREIRDYIRLVLFEPKVAEIN